MTLEKLSGMLHKRLSNPLDANLSSMAKIPAKYLQTLKVNWEEN